MSIRHGLLALLSQGPRYGYQLRAEFESSTGATWPLNIGQVYSTLSRLERDELVTRVGADDEGRFVYRITPAGEADVRRWFATPIVRADRPRDELAIKLAMAVTTPGVDVAEVVQTQRGATLRALQDLTRLKADAPAVPAEQGDRAWRLVLESMIFQAEAEVRWLDHCETYVARATPPAPPPAPTPNVPAATDEEARR
ncbi:PadR family transcriptional regulator [Actinomadura sp. KC216]|uniref:PadR family transcriptional regulator n=1 Tax=Actinomadura sp. KC216 TaxID=2530370 RepID=UPI00104DC9F7|nr:PadR family transcriptional regulator [Actinomadura sp. KC216]TDB89705.1 PadR family transcriptional regulator [Actinomadura sp. KC216]